MNKVYFTPTQAWLGSVYKVLLWPLGIWVLLAILGFPFFLYGSGLLLIAGLVGMVVHFVAYLMMGLLIYEVCWERCSFLWTRKAGLPLGAVTGGLTTTALVMLAEGTRTPTEADLFSISMIGALYGLLTAAAAIVTSGRGPNNEC